MTKKESHAQNVLFWVFARLKECERKGLIGGGKLTLSEKGEIAARLINSEGFVPQDDEIRNALKVIQEGADVPEEMVLLLKNVDRFGKFKEDCE